MNNRSNDPLRFTVGKIQCPQELHNEARKRWCRNLLGARVCFAQPIQLLAYLAVGIGNRSKVTVRAPQVSGPILAQTAVTGYWWSVSITFAFGKY
jgi:hypothetical protein